MIANTDRNEAADLLDDASKAIAALTALDARGFLPGGLATRMGDMSRDLSQAAEDLVRTDSGVVVRFGRANRLARPARGA